MRNSSHINYLKRLGIMYQIKSLKQARENGSLDQFAKYREADAPGDEEAFNRALQSMAGKSKADREASSRDVTGD